MEWKDPEHTPVTPRLIGTKVFDGYPLQDVVDFIDWNPFFSVCPSSQQQACTTASQPWSVHYVTLPRSRIKLPHLGARQQCASWLLSCVQV